MKIANSLFVILMLSLPTISAERSEVKMSDISSSASLSSSLLSSSRECMSDMRGMHDEMMATIEESNPDKAFAKGMVAHHEEAIAMVETGLEYGRNPEIRKLAQDIIRAQKDEIERVNTWLGSQE